MKTLFTKAPWLMNTTKKFLDNKGLAITDERSKLICEVSHNLSQLDIREYEANAKLIVAAPELLNALIEISKGNGRYDLDQKQHFRNCIEDMIKIAEDAIKKATE